MIVTALCDQAKKDMMDGVHQPGDTYRIALYTADADLNESTKKYSPKNESTGAGYKKGGYYLTGRRSALINGSACLTFNDVLEDRCTFEASGAVIYNESRNGATLATLAFDANKKPSNGKFELEFPLPTPSSSVIVII
jgi:malate synthase